MFSPALNPGPAPPVRNTRRRQRPTSNENTLAQPKTKRMRSSYDDTSFAAPESSPEMDEVKSNRVATLTRRESPKELAGSKREIAVRGKKPKAGDRSSKGDGSVVLTTNDTYTVSKLPALPDHIRTDISAIFGCFKWANGNWTARQHGAIYSDNGYALALTHSHAFVWQYAINIPSPETFTFALPQTSKHASDPLPLGSLVSASASTSEPGLVVVFPSSGKITYWDTISSAATLDLIKVKSNGVSSLIPGMMAGETVSQILNAESAGFVLTFSTGRLAYLRVRDGHGRPNISIQFLRGSSGPLAGGIFGSLRNVLSSSAWRGDIAAVRAGPQEHVGERNVVVATGKGRLQLWNLQRDGQNYLRSEAEGRESIVMAIKKAEPSLGDMLLETFEVLDLTFTPKSMIDDIDAPGAHLLLLTSLTSRRSSYYTLVNVVLNKDQLLVGNVRLLKSYTTPVNVHAISKPRLYLPEPGLVAYAVFDRAVVVLSMAKRPELPELQLRSEAHILPPSFEDVVDFRDDPNVEIVGSGMEEPQGQPHGIEEAKARKYKAKHPAAVLLVRGGGVLRVAATDIDKLASSKAQQVTAKSKLEQAVFFGTMAQNPLSFTGRAELQFTPEEVGAAALELSMDILKSKTPYIPSVPASIEQNLRKRSAALHDLAKHLKVTGVALDRVTRWKLLWDAEKMAAATIIWKNYDARVREQPEGQKRGLFTDLVEHIHEDYKSNPVAEEGELDRVRHYFINDIHDLQLAIPWSWQIIKYSYQDGSKNHATVLETLSQANDVAIGALGGAFDFRTANMDLYGLENEVLRYGILEDGYDGLPEFWTSTYYIAESTRKQADLCDMLLREFWDKPAGENYPEPHVIEKIRLENPTLIDMAIRTNNERIRWVSAQDDPQLQLQAGQLQALQLKSEDKQIQSLADTLDLPDEAMNLAEKHGILSTLASVLMFEVGITADKLRLPGLSQDDFDDLGLRMQALTNRMDKYFAKFGATWANALYEFFVERGLMRQMLDEYQNHREFLTGFLREKPEYAKIGWIHEITREKDYDEAAEMLLNLGLEREQDVWSKKVELSLGKLARIAGQKRSQGNDDAHIVRANQELGLIRIQDQIFQFIYPSIATAIDDKAEVQLALEIHGNKNLKQQVFVSLLEEAMAHLVKHEAMNALTLIDLLTLMGDNSKPLEDDALSYEKYYLALEASRLGISDKEERQLIQRVIWRRCFLRDDWSEVNNTESKDDQQVSEHLRTTALYWTLRTCFKNRIFDKDPTMSPLSPQEVLGACTDELDSRFVRSDASIRERFMGDMQSEDDALKPYINTCRLEKWHQGALDLARQDFRDEVEQETNEGGDMKMAAAALEDMEKSVADNERERAEGFLLSKPRTRAKRPVVKFEGRRSGSGSARSGSGSRSRSRAGEEFRSSVKLY
ncbi:hypothetical protein CJF32_00010252 [Rutstroemia sp. NJR-2017a WRK4]|nr:hypothetical protein CJF32_00010252 [Rutstroemia sp. NJR-2017a WRK4]